MFEKCMSQDHSVESMQSSTFMVVKFFVYVFFLSICLFVYFSVSVFLYLCDKTIQIKCQKKCNC